MKRHVPGEGGKPDMTDAQLERLRGTVATDLATGPGDLQRAVRMQARQEHVDANKGKGRDE